MRLVVKGTRDQYIEARIAGFTRGSDQVGAQHGSELWANEDGGALLGLTFHVTAFGTDQFARPRSEGGEGNAVLFMRLLHAGGLEVFENHLGEGLLAAIFLDRID